MLRRVAIDPDELKMRGKDEARGRLLRYVNMEADVSQDHYLRAIRDFTNAALAKASEEFAAPQSRTDLFGDCNGKNVVRAVV